MLQRTELYEGFNIWGLSSDSSRNFSRLQKVQSVQVGDRHSSCVYVLKPPSVGSTVVVPNITGMSTQLKRLDRALKG